MIAENIMVTDLVTVHEDDLVAGVFDKMRNAKLRMLPVLDGNQHIVGVISTFCVMEHIVPEYVLSGDLKQISYAPDIGILRRQYDQIAGKKISEIMNKEPLIVHDSESLLSVAASLSSYGRHEYAMVAGNDNIFLGVISAGDILDMLKNNTQELANA